MIIMDNVLNKLVGLGIPGLIFFYVFATCGYYGAAAITFSLAAIGPGGMIGGVATLVLAGLISSALAEYGFDKLNEAIVNEFKNRGKSKEDILNWINSRWYISGSKKAYLRELINEYYS